MVGRNLGFHGGGSELHWREASTRRTEKVADEAQDVGAWGLTVLCHPDAARVGEVALLDRLLESREQPVSRLEPYFAPPAGGGLRPPVEPRPLGDLHLSRRPLYLRPAPGDGVWLDPGAAATSVRIDGELVTEPRDLSRAELDDGVVVLLGGRVALLLHRLQPPGQIPPRYGLVGESAAMLRVRREIQALADVPHPVLLRGESGTGKELVARALHQAGPRRGRPCVCVNVGAIPSTLGAAELFGVVKGAHSTADRSRRGYFQRAGGGTLFLDEIGEAPRELQIQLLRAIETGQVQPVGSPEALEVDVRVIAATDADLEAVVARREFSAPLFHRLTYQLVLPPLRARRDDVGRLFFHFLRQELDGVGEAARLDHHPDADPWVPAELVARLARHGWPGNVRQLRNVVGRLVIASRGQPRMRVPPEVERLLRERPAPVPHDLEKRRRKPKDVSCAELRAVYRENHWEPGRTAAALKMKRTSLYRLMRRCRVREASDLSREEILDASERCGGETAAMADLFEVSERALKLRMTELGSGTDE